MNEMLKRVAAAIEDAANDAADPHEAPYCTGLMAEAAARAAITAMREPTDAMCLSATSQNYIDEIGAAGWVWQAMILAALKD